MKLIAGETITFDTPNGSLAVKIEDASKGDVFSGKVVASEDEAYAVEGVYEFDRASLPA